MHPCLALQGFRGGRRRNDSVAIGLSIRLPPKKLRNCTVSVLHIQFSIPDKLASGTSRFKSCLDLPVPATYSTTLTII